MFIENPDVVNAIISQLKVTHAEGIPQNFSPVIQGVIDLTPRHHRLTTINRSQTTTYAAVTIYTTPDPSTRQDFYLQQVVHSIAKDATSDAPTGAMIVRCVVDGQNVTLAPISTITLTAQQTSLTLRLDNPIKVDPGTNITIVALTGSLGLLYRTASVHGYLIQR